MRKKMLRAAPTPRSIRYRVLCTTIHTLKPHVLHGTSMPGKEVVAYKHESQESQARREVSTSASILPQMSLATCGPRNSGTKRTPISQPHICNTQGSTVRMWHQQDGNVSMSR